MADSVLEKEKLVSIVDACQNRTFAEELQFFEEQCGSHQWLISGVGSNATSGISNEQSKIQSRKQKYGSNEKYVKQPPGFCTLFCAALQDFTLRILIVASLLSIGIEVGTATPEQRKTAWIQGVAVMCAVMICATVTAANDYQKQRQFQQLNSVADARKTVTLHRDGQIMEIHQDKVLVGDIVKISEGMETPADGIILQANQVTTDESAMTGQSDPIHKNIVDVCLKKKKELEESGQKNTAGKHDVPSPILLSGTKILTGEGKMMVLVVGDSSCIGKIRVLLAQQEVDEETPLQKKLEKIAEDIGKFGLFSAIFILIVLLIRFAIEKGISRQWDTSKDLTEILDYFILAITVIVVAIPQGLPLAVTLSLAFSVKKMLVDNNLVRKMQACETMGGANTICSDKTGTLTLNKMTFTKYWSNSLKDIDSYAQSGTVQQYFHNIKVAQLFKISACVNSTAILNPQPKGSSTQLAFLNFMTKMGVSYEQYREKYPTKLKYPFSSARKRMSVIVEYEDSNVLFVKGASEMVLASCSQWYNMETGQIQEITSVVRERMQNAITQMAQNSLRTLCFAFKKLRASDNINQKDQKGVFTVQKSELVVIALVGVKDIPRQEVPEAIRQCNRAGIKVRMVTGDNLITAKAIAREVGIIKQGDDSLIMQGSQFIKLIGGVVCKKCQVPVCNCAKDQEQAKQTGEDIRVDTIKNGDEFRKIKDRLAVLARSRPQDKYALVTGLKQNGDIVAVTGDGTNDAPALKKADVGFAMGINGTEVAREAAAIILIDDNFNSIVKAVLWGRNIYDAIRKFIQFQLTVNVVAVFITLIGAALIKQEVLKPIQMLWINLIMDTLASLALATEPPNEGLLDRHPHSRDEYIISATMFKHILGQGIFQTIVLLTLIFAGDHFIPEFSDSYDDSVFANHLDWKYKDGMMGPGATVRSGRFKYIDGEDDYSQVFDETHIYSRHFTFIFNTFVLLQIFNFLNARKLQQQINIFAGITNNLMFVGIVVLIFFLQILLITFAGIAFGVYSNFGLTIHQWLICIGIASITLLVSVILKLIPIKSGVQYGNEESTMRTKKKTLSLKRIQSRVQRDLAKNSLHSIKKI